MGFIKLNGLVLERRREDGSYALGVFTPTTSLERAIEIALCRAEWWLREERERASRGYTERRRAPDMVPDITTYKSNK